MPTFGPHYPFQLQQVIDHAERFATLLASEGIQRRASTDLGRAWLVGRADEVEIVVGTMIEDWRVGRLTETAVATAVSAYLAAMHAAADRHLTLGAEAPCCLGEGATTLPLTQYDAETGGEDTLAESPVADADLGGSRRP